jgi:predicted thioredoxin/glutaredoxin
MGNDRTKTLENIVRQGARAARESFDAQVEAVGERGALHFAAAMERAALATLDLQQERDIDIADAPTHMLTMMASNHVSATIETLRDLAAGADEDDHYMAVIIHLSELLTILRELHQRPEDVRPPMNPDGSPPTPAA